MDAKTLRIVINTLEKVAVAGEDNMNYMLGVMRLLKSELVKMCEEEEANEEIHSAE